MDKSDNTLGHLIVTSSGHVSNTAPLIITDEPAIAPVSDKLPASVSSGELRSKKSVENAIYAYMRAIRALGRTRVNTNEIAEALSISAIDIARALISLRKKGVRVVNG